MIEGTFVQIVEMTIAHYDQVMSLLRNTSGVTLRDVDSHESIDRYLNRNPGFSFIAVNEGKIVGCAMCGHDGRRGYLQHVAVLEKFWGKGIANNLVNHCLDKLEEAGIFKTHLDVVMTNDLASKYWQRRGWQRRDDLIKYSFIRQGSESA